MNSTASAELKGGDFVRLGPQVRPRRGQIALVPGEMAPILPLDLPAALRGAVREQVAQRQVQDLIGQGVEMRPFTAGQPVDGWARVLVADAADMARWRAEAGEECRAVLPDYLALPAAEGVWVLSEEAGICLARLGPQDGFSAEPTLAVRLLARAAVETPPKAIWPMGALSDAVEGFVRGLGVPMLARAEQAAGLDLSVPRLLAHGEVACDLRRDPQAARQAIKRGLLPWGLAAVFAALALGMWGASVLLETRRMEVASEQERDLMLAQTRESFVPNGPILDVRAQVSRAIGDLQTKASGKRDKTSGLDLFARGAQVIAAQRAELEAASFAEATGLSVAVQVRDFAALDALSVAFVGAGLVAEIGQSNLDESRNNVRAEVRLRTAEGG